MAEKLSTREREIGEAYQNVQEQRIRYEDYEAALESAAKTLTVAFEVYEEAALDYKRAMRELDALVRELAEETSDA